MDKKQLKAKKKEFDRLRRQKEQSSRGKPIKKAMPANKSSGSRPATKGSVAKPPRQGATAKRPPSSTVARRPKSLVRRKKNYAIYYILLTIVIVVSGIILTRNYLFIIDKITVTTNLNFDKEKLITDSGILIGESMLKLSTAPCQQNILDKNYQIDSVSIVRKFPNEILIEAEVATPYVIVKGEKTKQYYTISAGQRIIEISETLGKKPKAIVLEGIPVNEDVLGANAKLSQHKNFAKYKTIKTALEKKEITKVLSIDLSDIYNIKVVLSGELTINLGNSTELDYKLTFAKRIMDTELAKGEKGEIEVSTVGRGSFIPKQQDNSSSSSSSSSSSQSDSESELDSSGLADGSSSQ